MPSAPPVPIALDESLRDNLQLSPELARARGIVGGVLKLGPLGGFFRVLRLARQLRGAGIGLVVSHTLEGPVGTAAATELALALGPNQMAPGLASHGGLGAWRDVDVPAHRGARLVPHQQPGLGLPRLSP
jgi:L-alanine-DL-glutamate epimerase-like enolase superfamily enzyme